MCETDKFRIISCHHINKSLVTISSLSKTHDFILFGFSVKYVDFKETGSVSNGGLAPDQKCFSYPKISRFYILHFHVRRDEQANKIDLERIFCFERSLVCVEMIFSSSFVAVVSPPILDDWRVAELA